MEKLMYIAGIAIMWATFSTMSSCQYLNVVPDDVPTLDNAFALRAQAKEFLFTCYSFMPKSGNLGQDPAMEGGDEIWRVIANGSQMFNIARGFQNVVDPYGDFYWTNMYRGIRDCNIFLDNIEGVPDMEETEKRQWIGEVKFLKAYYHFCLLRMYGPIPIVRRDLPINADTKEVQVYRDPVDSCFHYIVQLLDEAAPSLPLNLEDPSQEAGRITRAIDLSFKAKVLVYAASPLFNGNTDEATLTGSDGTSLFNQTFSKEKWDLAAAACRQAIDACEQSGIKLYEFGSNYQQFHLSDTIATQLSIRNSVCEKWNDEIIWANTQSNSSVQSLALPPLDPSHPENYVPRGELSPPLKIAEMFYTDNGVPITEDKTWDYAARYSLRTASDSDRLYIRSGYTSAYLNFNREPRYYADLAFDGGIWYGQGKYDDTKDQNLFYVAAKWGQPMSVQTDRGTVTGYFIKKLIHFENVIGTGTTYSVNNYPWPLIRLSGLYLLCAEAINESAGPGPEAYKYIDLVRQRAGLPSVETAWARYSTNPGKFTTQKGFRDIVHREREIELAFEAQRFWDLRRWKEATTELNRPIQGWDGKQSDAAGYYRPITIFNQVFGTKDYFWPISEGNITIDKNLVQNIGW